MRDSYPVYLVKADGTQIEGHLFEGLTEENLRHYEQIWRPELHRLRLEAQTRRARGEECYDGADAHWDWRRLSEKALDHLSIRQFVVETDGETQGLMQINLLQRSRIEPGQHLIYVDRLAAAPWNRRSELAKKRFRPVGLLLIRHAIGTSIAEGFAGRVGLHSLPGSVSFYRDKLQMQAFGGDSDHQDLEYFELSAAQAQKELTHD